MGLDDAFARDGRGDDGSVGGALDLFDGVDGRQAGDRGAVALDFADHIGDDLVVHEWPHRIVHQDHIVRHGPDVGQSVGYGFLAMLATFHRLYLRRDLLFFQVAAEALQQDCSGLLLPRRGQRIVEQG